MELGMIFSQDFQKAMKRAARGTQKGTASESSSVSISNETKNKVTGKGINAGNFSFSVPKRQKDALEQTKDQVSA